MAGADETSPLQTETAARILAEIRRRKEAARIELAETLNLSPATVTAVTAALLERGLILESTPMAMPGRGRPRMQLTLNAEALHVVGAKLNSNAVTAAVLDFTGEIMAEAAAPLDKVPVDPETLVAKVHEAVDRALAQTGMTENDIAAFGFGMPGFVDAAPGICHWSPLMSGAPLNAHDLLQKTLPCPVFIDNDANLVTLAELWFGHGREERNFLVVTVEHGVGLGIVIDGKIYRGARGLGAEFGHIKVQADGALCRCGQRGCLEAYVADFALMREASTALDILDVTAQPEAILKKLAEKANAGHEAAASIYRRAGRMLGLGVANLCNLFDPSLVVLSGERIHNHHLLAAEMERVLNANRLVADRAPTPLAVHRWGDSLWARGAGALALDGLMAASTAGEKGVPQYAATA